MSNAQTFTLDFTEEDLSPSGNYADFEAGDYRGVLTEVKDAKANSGNVGYKWVFQVNGLPFDITTWLKGGGLWKLNEVISAMGGTLVKGDFDPNLYVGSEAGVKIGKDPKQQDDRYKDRLVILRTFPLPDATSIFEVPEI